jgi:hypothetical protein
MTRGRRRGAAKNIVIVSAAIVLGATVRGGELVPEPVGEEAQHRDT